MIQSVLTTEETITIHAPIQKVWEALTTPQLRKQWFFGVDTDTDWKIGSSIVHRGEYQGKPYQDKGFILKFDPPHVLSHSHWSAGSKLPDKPENYQQVTYALTEHDGHTDLTMTEVNLPSEEAKVVSEKSWKMVLKTLKEMLEK